MNKMVYLIIGIIIIGSIAYFLFKRKKDVDNDEFFISTQTESNNRIKSLGLDKSSEDASHILDTSQISFPDDKINFEKDEYKADPTRDWIITITSLDNIPFHTGDLMKLFDYEWRSNFRSGIYGHSIEKKKWTYALAGDSPNSFDKIQVAVNLIDTFNDEDPNYNTEKLERYIIELNKRIKRYPVKLEIQKVEDISQAIEKAKKLVQLNHVFNQDVIIVLKSEKTFKGIEMWDALLSVGLKWGDGDLFHWNNHHSGYGDGQFFTVWTTTAPGYFLPEEIKKGNMNPTDLVFGFTIPRSADPENVFTAMVNSAKYCRTRLGGTILNQDGHPFDENKEFKELVDLISKMKENGIHPGSESALMTF